MAGSLAPMIQKQGVGAVWRSLARSAVWPADWYKKLLEGGAIERKADEDEDTKFLQFIASIQTQLGVALWALDVLGVPLSDLGRDPGDKLRGDTAAKLLRWADEAEDLTRGVSPGSGRYDGAALRREIRCRLKQKSARE